MRYNSHTQPIIKCGGAVKGEETKSDRCLDTFLMTEVRLDVSRKNILACLVNTSAELRLPTGYSTSAANTLGMK